MTAAIAVIIALETDDPLLQPDTLDCSTVQATARLRQAIVKALPGRLTRVVAVMDIAQAEIMMLAHDRAMRESGAEVLWPPAAYIPPGRE
jgi:hypothetical protein